MKTSIQLFVYLFLFCPICLAQQTVPTLLEPEHKFCQSEFEKNAIVEIREIFSKKEQFGQMYNHPELTAYLQSIVEELKPENLVDIPTPVKVSKSPVVNAMMFVDGTILVNLGLLINFQREDELAFVMAHELAHLILRHGLKNYLSGEKYEKRKSKSPSAMRKWIRSYTSFSQEAELEADSMAIVLLQKSKYNPYATYRAMDILDDDDTTTQKVPKMLRLLIGITETVSTHPPKSVRLKKINSVLQGVPDKGVKTDSATYQSMMTPHYLEYAQQLTKVPASITIIYELDRLLAIENMQSMEYSYPIMLLRAEKLLDLFANREEGAYRLHHYLYELGKLDHLPKFNSFTLKHKVDYDRYDDWMLKEKNNTKEYLLTISEQEALRPGALRLLGLFAHFENNKNDFKKYITEYLELKPDANDAFYFKHLLKKA